MNSQLKTSVAAAVATCLFAIPCITVHVYASGTNEENPLRFYKGKNDSYMQITFEADFAVFNQKNSWFGNSKRVLQGEKNDFWWESLVRPGIEGSFTLSNDQKLYGRLDAVQANTGSEIDAGGTNIGLGAVSDLRIENAYAGWRSGNLFSSLGEDFLDISFGRQQYVVGNGMLFHGEGGSGYNRAAWYLGGRTSAEYAGIVRMKSGGWSGDLVYLEADDIAQTNTRAGGATMDYTFDKLGAIGGGIYSIESNDQNRPARDGMKIYDIRGSYKPFAMSEALSALKPIQFEAEYSYEDKTQNFGEGNGWNVAVSYQFDQIPWKPCLTYRYASFNENFDPLFTGSTDWSTWAQGEIVGEFVLGNTNLDSNMIRLKMQPVEPFTVNLIYYHFTLHDQAAFTHNNSKTIAAPVTSKDYADEFDVIFDWAVNKNLTLSLVGAVALPGDAAIQHTGGSENWSSVMLSGCLKF